MTYAVDCGSAFPDKKPKPAHAVLNGGTPDASINYVSVSQIQTFDPQSGGCNRKWWFEKIAGFKSTGTKAQAIGTEGHKQIEHYLLTGEDVLGRFARAGKRFLPVPKTVSVELALHEAHRPLTAAGVLVVGYSDVVNTSGVWVDDDGARHDETAPEIVDWKFTSDLKYAKTIAQLKESTQMVGYAAWALRNFPTDTVRISHGYFRTKGAPYAEKRSTTINVETVNSAWHRVEAVVADMKNAATVGQIDGITPNYEACQSYGGCPYRDKCPRTAESWLTNFKRSDNTMGLMDNFKKNQKAGLAPIVAEIAALVAEENQARGILPPDAPRSEPPYSAAPIADKTDLTPALAESAAKWDVEIGTTFTLPDASAEAHEAVVKSKRGRKPKNYTVVEENPPGMMTVADVMQAAQSGLLTVSTTTATVAADGDEGGVLPNIVKPQGGVALYVDCVVDGLNPVSLEGYISNLCRQMEAEYSAVDIRCAPMDSAIAYNKWKGVLAALVRTQPPANGNYVLNGVRESEIRQVVVEALRPTLALYVRGAL